MARVPRSSLASSSSPTSEQRTRSTGTLVGLSMVVVFVVGATSGYGSGQDALLLVNLGDVYGLLAAGLLYLTLLISPLAGAFPRLPGKTTWFLARRGLGLSSLMFAVPHALVSFFGPLGGFSGIPFLDPYTGWALVLGTFGLLVLLVLGTTASDAAVRTFGAGRWKLLHRSVYIAGVVTLVHLFLVGTHYGDPHSPWTFWTLGALAFLLFLEALRFDVWWAKKFPKDRRYGPAALLVVVLITSAWFWTSAPTEPRATGGVRWVTGHHGMILPAPNPAPEAKP